ncbi:MAG: dihydropteroate synthase [Candidatus Peregrinibacteria bacterium Greene0416_62]|nr:MAG: dihydropteroate synthase [Candidatus Peregrinibacteria bacterium Greene0416_62]TSD00373.1 MAG: dihydropteroate synthase [Candidatus Peregrinibacteria bacterium Greene1014_49]
MQSDLQIVGILNVTPDSYYDGGMWNAVGAALKRAKEMLKEGADWIEIGGESTGPKSKDVSLEQELARVIPVIDAIHKKFPEAKLSVDTYKSAIAREAIAAGVTMVNDVTAGRGDAEMFGTIAQSQIAHSNISGQANRKSQIPLLVLMYSKDSTPRTTIAETQYKDVVATIRAFLKARRDAAIAAGIPADRIILDPGLGHFVSSIPKYSYEILARLSEFKDLDCPLFISPSRKSFLAGSENLPVSERLPATIAASMIAALNGARYIRTHDVADIRRACAVIEQLSQA